MPIFAIIIVSMPAISQLWIGHYEKIFVIMGIILALGWVLNMLNAPAYFAYLSIGELRWNVISHISIMVFNIFLGFILGTTFGGYGVVFAWVISLALGSSIIGFSYHMKHKISFIEFLPTDGKVLYVISMVGIIFIVGTRHFISKLVRLNSILSILFFLTLFLSVYFHPMRKRLMGWISGELLNRKAGVRINK